MGWFNIYAYIKIVSSRTACATKQNFFKKEKKEKKWTSNFDLRLTMAIKQNA